MKTDDLINLLGTNLEPVRNGHWRNTLLAALGLGTAAALCLTMVILGAPTNAFQSEYLGFRALGVVFALSLVAAGTSFLLRAARPGQPRRGPLVIIVLLFLAIVAAGIVSLLASSPLDLDNMVFGSQWGACLLCVPLFAIVPFVTLTWALRQGAPTSPIWTGAVAGLVAGALSAATYTFQHPIGSIPYIAIWFGGPILICALVGALLGPRLLRW